MPDAIAAWTDPVYRCELSDEDYAALPDNPVGEIELAGYLGRFGAAGPVPQATEGLLSLGCCGGFTNGQVWSCHTCATCDTCGRTCGTLSCPVPGPATC